MKNTKLHQNIMKLVNNLNQMTCMCDYYGSNYIMNQNNLWAILKYTTQFHYNQYVKKYDHISVIVDTNVNNSLMPRNFFSFLQHVDSFESHKLGDYFIMICEEIGLDINSLTALTAEIGIDKICYRIDEILMDCRNELANIQNNTSFHTSVINKVNVQIVPFNNPEPSESKKCECGADKCGGKHSDYCPKYGE